MTVPAQARPHVTPFYVHIVRSSPLLSPSLFSFLSLVCCLLDSLILELLSYSSSDSVTLQQTKQKQPVRDLSPLLEEGTLEIESKPLSKAI